jgi:hypothetical protein
MKRYIICVLFLTCGALFPFSTARAQCAVSGGMGLVIPQIADGGGWMTTLVITNTGITQSAPGLVFFHDAGGGATTLWNLDFAEMTSAQVQALSVPPGSTIFLHTLASAQATTAGWGILSRWNGCGNGSPNFYAIFTQRSPGGADHDGTGEGTIPQHGFMVPFDNTNGAVTSVAIANPGSAQTISLAVRTSDGVVTQLPAITLPLGGHISFDFPTQFPSTVGKTGLAEFYGPSDMFSILALRFSAGGFTTTPVYYVAGPPTIVSIP